jgi:hypothetical protein
MKKILTVSILSLLCCMAAIAQQTEDQTTENRQKAFSSWGIGVNAGTYGVGGTLITKIHPHWVVRAGYDYANYTYKPSDLKIDVEYEGYEFQAKVNSLNLKFPNAKLLIDYYPFSNGLFSLTTGLYFGKNRIKLEGYASEKFEFEDIVIQPDPVTGYFDAFLALGKSVKPYFGIGLGRSLANKRIGFRFDLGAVYQGKYKVTSNYMTEESVASSNDALKDVIPKSVAELWPMMNFSLSYRFK